MEVITLFKVLVKLHDLSNRYPLKKVKGESDHNSYYKVEDLLFSIYRGEPYHYVDVFYRGLRIQQFKNYLLIDKIIKSIMDMQAKKEFNI